MLIPVILKNGECKLVDGDLLNELIAQGKIKSFLRLSGWTDADEKAIRTKDRKGYKGQERRQEFTLYDDGLTGTSLSCDKDDNKGKKQEK